MESTMPESYLNDYLLSKKVRDADLATLRERLEQKIEEWFYECAVPNGIYDDSEDEPVISPYTIWMMEYWNRGKAFDALPLDRQRKRLRELWARRMERARLAFQKTYDGHPEVYERNLSFFLALADNYKPTTK